MSKIKKKRKLQAIPGNGKKPQPSGVITITVTGGQVQIQGFPNNLDMTLDILHQANKAVVKFFLNALTKQAKETQSVELEKREFMGARH